MMGLLRPGSYHPIFLSDTFTEETNCFSVLLSPESAAALTLGSLLVSLVLCMIPSLTEDESTIVSKLQLG